MDLVTQLRKMVDNSDILDPGRKATLSKNLSQIGKEGSNTAFRIIKAYRDNIDKEVLMGETDIPYYGLSRDVKNDAALANIEFDANELPNELLLILELFLQQK